MRDSPTILSLAVGLIVPAHFQHGEVPDARTFEPSGALAIATGRKILVSDRSRLAADLEGLLEGALTEEEFRLRFQSAPASALVDAIWGNLEHYLSYGDIRGRDPSRGQQTITRDASHRLLRGQVGTVVELLDGAYEVEFADDEGKTYATSRAGRDPRRLLQA